MIETVCAGGVVLNNLGEVAVVSQHGNYWSLPKGHVDAGEEILTAAKREIMEETGLTQLTLIKSFEPYQRYRGNRQGGNDERELKTIHMFLFRTTQLDLTPIDPHNPEARWVSPEDVSDMLTHPKDKEFFSQVGLLALESEKH